MRIKCYSSGAQGWRAHGILNLLRRIDDEPSAPPSLLDPGIQKIPASNESVMDGPLAYHRAIASQNFILGLEDNANIIAFLSYRSNFALPRSDAMNWQSTFYVTTAIVDPNHQHRKIMSLLYRDLISRADSANFSVSTSTLSLDATHLSLLKELGFCEVNRADVRDGREAITYLERPTSSQD